MFYGKIVLSETIKANAFLKTLRLRICEQVSNIQLNLINLNSVAMLHHNNEYHKGFEQNCLSENCNLSTFLRYFIL
jgi:hypothetical protein